MSNYINTFIIVLFSLTSLLLSTNLSTYARSSSYLKEDMEIALHDASLQVDLEKLAEGLVVFNEDEVKKTFKESFELNTNLKSTDYEIIEFEIFDHSNSTFPVEYESTKTRFKDTFLYPTVLAIVKTKTNKYFFISSEKEVARVASYSYKIKNNNPIFNPIIDTKPNAKGFYWVLPHTNNITSYFTPQRINPVTKEVEFHKGIDIASPDVLGKNVVSAKDGIVTFAGEMGTYGNMVEITHSDGLVTRYAHLQQVLVRSGQSVSGGEIIGTVGNTGRSTGEHLHFETILNGTHVDPLSFY